jgi:hypothetical protein
MTLTLGEALPQEQARCRELLTQYKQIGPAGVFGAAMIEAALKRADQAVMSGDPVAMLRTYDELKKCE